MNHEKNNQKSAQTKAKIASEKHTIKSGTSFSFEFADNKSMDEDGQFADNAYLLKFNQVTGQRHLDINLLLKESFIKPLLIDSSLSFLFPPKQDKK